MFYDFIISRGNENVQNNIAFMRRQLELTSLQEEFMLLKDCIATFLQKTNEDIEEQVRLLLSNIINQNVPLDNETSLRFVSEYIAALKIFDYNLYLIRRDDMVEDIPLDDGVAICYLLDIKNAQISNICSGIGREFDDMNSPINVNDSVMTWFVSGDIQLSNDIEQICFLDNIKNDYANMRRRNSSIDFESAEKMHRVLTTLGQKPILITNIAPDEFTLNQNFEDNLTGESTNEPIY